MSNLSIQSSKVNEVEELVDAGFSREEAEAEVNATPGAIAPVSSSPSAAIAKGKPLAEVAELDLEFVPAAIYDGADELSQIFEAGRGLAHSTGDAQVRVFSEGVETGFQEVQRRNADFFRSVQRQIAARNAFGSNFNG